MLPSVIADPDDPLPLSAPTVAVQGNEHARAALRAKRLKDDGIESVFIAFLSSLLVKESPAEAETALAGTSELCKDEAMPGLAVRQA
jgi:hypothetical protein